MMRNLARPPLRRRRRDDEKPPMPENLEPHAAAAERRMARRYANPGAAVEVEKLSENTYRVVSPHQDHDAWHAMICDAFGTNSESTARTFLHSLSELCRQHRYTSGDPDPNTGIAPGEYCPDETELNMILNMVGSIRPKNEMEAALAAQMVAVHLMTMKGAAATLTGWTLDMRTAAITGKLARTFAMQMETLQKLRGKGRNTKQKIVVTHDKHIHQHHHQHVHLEGGSADFGGQPREPSDDRNRTARPDRTQAIPDARGSTLLGADAAGVVVPMPSKQGQEPVPHPRRGKGVGRAEG